jgi:hypothetical protein
VEQEVGAKFEEAVEIDYYRAILFITVKHYGGEAHHGSFMPVKGAPFHHTKSVIIAQFINM